MRSNSEQQPPSNSNYALTPDCRQSHHGHEPQATDLISTSLHRPTHLLRPLTRPNEKEKQEKRSTLTHTPKIKLDLGMEGGGHRIDFGFVFCYRGEGAARVYEIFFLVAPNSYFNFILLFVAICENFLSPQNGIKQIN